MADTSFFELTEADRRDALEVAASQTGRPAYLLEKDVWVVLTLQALLNSSLGEHLTFKGGTSLSKGYQAIQRFSEDLDITHDIRVLAPDLAGEDLPNASRNRRDNVRKEIARRLNDWVQNDALPIIEDGLGEAGGSARVRLVGEKIYVVYQPLFDDYRVVRPEVMVEFGGLDTGEPHERRIIECDAAWFIPDVAFPSASPFVMRPERTFWEKATLIHVFCERQKGRGERHSRHWHDLVRLDDTGYAETALVDRALAQTVAQYKESFFREKRSDGEWIDYEAAVSGHLRLTPSGEAYDALADDYEGMVHSGMLHGDSESFQELMARCTHIQARANA
ncbi:MAG: nucleotidyl transferase AbiEii/AbiGii toxin family protein [Chloroflexi bacterium]|nr:nucleotidyl transferase AbiEii/AbiGii toxin family protein [Chloroflexota bacterium]MYF79059.1 nucleotidyl transferase AbiEii/AbiGii toxin family protein [Chloroflexota bacterium]MYK33922.1 nucleotidyl transferase AbiEii/AbiGii toxin family protein [Chloroflexota bacterium]